jgi:hypothetical protein
MFFSFYGGHRMKPFPKAEQGRGGGTQTESGGLGSYSVRKDTRKLETRIETQLTELEVLFLIHTPHHTHTHAHTD